MELTDLVTERGCEYKQWLPTKHTKDTKREAIADVLAI